MTLTPSNLGLAPAARIHGLGARQKATSCGDTCYAAYREAWQYCRDTYGTNRSAYWDCIHKAEQDYFNCTASCGLAGIKGLGQEPPPAPAPPPQFTFPPQIVLESPGPPEIVIVEHEPRPNWVTIAALGLLALLVLKK